MLALTALFWLALGGLVYIYVGYPLLVWMAGSLSHQAEVCENDASTPLSIVIASYNEAHRLAEKLDSLLACDCAAQIAEVLVGSDGSTDDTRQVVDAYPDERVQLFSFGSRRGKPAILNDLVPRCTSPVVVLTDARQLIDPQALSRLRAWFADDAVGVVSGELKFRTTPDHSMTASGVGIYWRYEKFIRRCESRFRSVPGATGALYALRRELFRPISDNTLLDDVVIPMQAIEQGYRCRLALGAVAWDEPSQSPSQEAVRKRRTIAGCVQLVVNQPRWLLPWRNPIWWEFVSHKLARLLSPVLMAVVLVTNVMLAGQPLYLTLLGLQGLFYASAAVGWMLQRFGGGRWLGGSVMFVSLNATTVAAIWDAARGRYRAAWQKTT